MASSFPTFLELLENFVAAAMRSARFGVPATIMEYDATRQSAVVSPAIKTRRIDENGDVAYDTPPPINDVPVIQAGSGKYRVHCPVSVGDTVMLVFADYDIDSWARNGGVGSPETDRVHSVNDAVAITGLHSFSDPLKDVPNDRMSIGIDEGTQITIRDDDIRLGSDSASDPVVLKSDLDALESVFSTWTPVAGDGGAALKGLLTTLINSGWPNGATKLKGE